MRMRNYAIIHPKLCEILSHEMLLWLGSSEFSISSQNFGEYINVSLMSPVNTLVC